MMRITYRRSRYHQKGECGECDYYLASPLSAVVGECERPDRKMKTFVRFDFGCQEELEGLLSGKYVDLHGLGQVRRRWL